MYRCELSARVAQRIHVYMYTCIHVYMYTCTCTCTHVQVRALRPLRALRSLPGMPPLVQSILYSLPKLGNVVMLCAMLFVVAGTVGVELFMGALHYRCAAPGFDEAAASAASSSLPWGVDEQSPYARMHACMAWRACTCMACVHAPAWHACMYLHGMRACTCMACVHAPACDAYIMQV